MKRGAEPAWFAAGRRAAAFCASALLGLAVGWAARGRIGPNADEYAAQGVRLYEAGNSIEAEKAFRKALAYDEECMEARTGLARIGRDRGDWALVASALEHITSDWPIAAQLLVIRGDAWVRLGFARRARQAWLKALSLSPRLWEAKRRLLFLYGLQLRRDLWISTLWELYDAGQVNMKEMIQLMIAPHVIWDTDEAIRYVRAFAERDPADRDSRRALGLYLARAGRMNEAVAHLRWLVESDPNDKESWLALLQCYAESGDRDRMREALRQAVRFADYRLDRAEGTLAMLEGDFKTAAEKFREALKRKPYDKESHNKLSRTYKLLGNEKESNRHAEVASLLAKIERMCHTLHSGGEPTAERFLDLVHWCERLGLIEEALGWLRIGLQQHTGDKRLIGEQQRLEALPRTSTRNPPDPLPWIGWDTAGSAKTTQGTSSSSLPYSTYAGVLVLSGRVRQLEASEFVSG